MWTGSGKTLVLWLAALGNHPFPKGSAHKASLLSLKRKDFLMALLQKHAKMVQMLSIMIDVSGLDLKRIKISGSFTTTSMHPWPHLNDPEVAFGNIQSRFDCLWSLQVWIWCSTVASRDSISQELPTSKSDTDTKKETVRSSLLYKKAGMNVKSLDWLAERVYVGEKT
jgi:hypothetical protein